jgi:cation transport ATPase
VGGPFYRLAWSGLKHGTANMSVLVTLGTTAAFGYSIISMVGIPCAITLPDLATPQQVHQETLDKGAEQFQHARWFH